MAIKLNPLARLAGIESRFKFLGTSYRSRENNPHLVSMAIARGEEVWVDGKLRKVTPAEEGKIMTLAKLHRVVTQAEKSAGDEWRSLKPILENAERPRAELMGFQQQRNEAAARLGALQAQIAAAENDLEAATANTARVEKELEKILDAAGIQ